MSRWYIIHAYSGFENKVRESIMSEAKRLGLEAAVEAIEVPTETITAFLEHGRVARTLDRGLDEARDALRAVEAQGIPMETVTRELIEEGVASFAKSFDELIATIEREREAVASA